MTSLMDFVPQSLREALSSFDQNARLLSFTGPEVGANLIVEKALVDEGVNRLFHLSIDLLSASAALDPQLFIAQEVTLGVLDAHRTPRNWHGLVTEAHFLGADGGFARYRLIVEPWLALLARRHDCYLFQDLDVLGIADALFADYPLARYEIRVGDGMRARLPKYRIRTQWDESDLDFLLRILSDDGLSFFFEHDPESVPGGTTSGSGTRHTLVIVDSSPAWAAAAQPVIRYHRSAATEAEDSIHALVAESSIGSGAVIRSGWDIHSVIAPSGANDADPGGSQAPVLEDYDGSASIPPVSTPLADAIALRSELAAVAHVQDRHRWRGLSSVRTLAPGTAFTLVDHPDWVGGGSGVANAGGFGLAAPGGRFAVVGATHHLRNNLKLGRRAWEASDAHDDDDFGSDSDIGIDAAIFESEFTCIPADVPIVLVPTPRAARPGLQTALVVGVAGEVLTAVRDHAVKVQFHWQRGDTPNAGGSMETGTPDAERGTDAGNAPGSERSGTWVRVAQSIAGPDFGEVFLPRIGDEVLVDFEWGDPDRPIIVKQLHNGQDIPPYSAGVDAGFDHPGVISGLHATTLDESGYNELVFDDAFGQPGVRAASSNQSSQLNLGHLLGTQPASAARGNVRGQGFEWTTDGWAVARAQQGVLLSTTMRQGAAGTVLDTSEAQGQIKAAQSLTQALSESSTHQGAGALTAPKVQDALLASLAENDANANSDASSGGNTAGSRVQPPVPAFGTPLLMVEAPATIAFTTPGTLLGYAGNHHQAIVQGDALHSAAKTWSSISGIATSLYAHVGGIAVIAAGNPVSVQSHVDQLEVLADQDVTITSTDADITVLAAKIITLTAGGAAITLNGQDITFACSGNFSVKGADQAWGNGAKGAANFPRMPDGSTKIPNWIAIDYRDAYGDPMSGVGYKIKFDTGEIISGKLDQNGYARHDDVPDHTAATVTYDERAPKPEASWEPLHKAPAAAQSLGSMFPAPPTTAAANTAS